MSKPRKARIAAPTIEQKIELIKSVMLRYVHPSLREKREWGSVKGASLQWSFGLYSTDQSTEQYALVIRVRHGAFAENEQVTERRWYQLASVEEHEIVNALFAALTWAHSPYRFNGEWKKAMEIAG